MFSILSGRCLFSRPSPPRQEDDEEIAQHKHEEALKRIAVFLDRLEDDNQVLSGEHPGFEQLGVVPRAMGGQSLDYIRHRRSGGYDQGATVVELPPEGTLR